MNQAFTKVEELLKDRIDQVISEHESCLGRGQVNPDSLAKDYWQKVGLIAGLREANLILASVLKDLEYGTTEPDRPAGRRSHNPYSDS